MIIITLYRCVDYVQVDMGIYGITESCGKDYSDIDNLIIQGVHRYYP